MMIGLVLIGLLVVGLLLFAEMMSSPKAPRPYTIRYGYIERARADDGDDRHDGLLDDQVRDRRPPKNHARVRR